MSGRSISALNRIPLKLRVFIAYVLGPLLLWSPTRIRRGLANRGYSILPSVAGIKKFCEKFRLTDSIYDRPRARKKTLLSRNCLECVNFLIKKDREITNEKLRRKINELFGVKVGRVTMSKAIKGLGWKKARTRYCQFIRKGNRVKRVVYALSCISDNEDYSDCIFTDETTVQLSSNGSLRFRRKGEPPILSKIGKPKHPYKVHVWAGISYKGPTPLCVFTGKLNAIGLEAIFSRALVPFIKAKFPPGERHRFIQDNDPKHTSKRINGFLRDEGIHYWRTPPESPDLNPIEMIWADMKRSLTLMRPQNGEDLVKGITVYWQNLTAEKCQRFIDHVRKVLPVVVTQHGGATGH